jgi:DNA-binding transcriptional MerR regulator
VSEPGSNSAGLPPKLYFRIGEVAELVGVEPHVLRYWEREFRTIRPTKSARGQRVYSRRDVENLVRVRELLYREGFTIAGAKKKLLHPVPPGKDADGEARSVVAAPAAAAAALPVLAASPAPAPPSPALPAAPDGLGAAHAAMVREELHALRSEIEGLLAEMEATEKPTA